MPADAACGGALDTYGKAFYFTKNPGKAHHVNTPCMPLAPCAARHGLPTAWTMWSCPLASGLISRRGTVHRRPRLATGCEGLARPHRDRRPTRCWPDRPARRRRGRAAGNGQRRHCFRHSHAWHGSSFALIDAGALNSRAPPPPPAQSILVPGRSLPGQPPPRSSTDIGGGGDNGSTPLASRIAHLDCRLMSRSAANRWRTRGGGVRGL